LTGRRKLWPLRQTTEIAISASAWRCSNMPAITSTTIGHSSGVAAPSA
jgi:hypothetical protein